MNASHLLVKRTAKFFQNFKKDGTEDSSLRLIEPRRSEETSRRWFKNSDVLSFSF
jgi:hypothetical protein